MTDMNNKLTEDEYQAHIKTIVFEDHTFEEDPELQDKIEFKQKAHRKRLRLSKTPVPEDEKHPKFQHNSVVNHPGRNPDDDRALEFIDIETGEIQLLTREDFSFHGMPTTVKHEKYDVLTMQEKYKHSSSLVHTAKKLGITNRKCEQLNKLYQKASYMGVFEENQEIKDMLGKNWNQCLEKLRAEGWIKRVFITSEQYYAYKPTKAHWIINPRFTVERDEWPTRERRQWLKTCFKDGLIRSYE